MSIEQLISNYGLSENFKEIIDYASTICRNHGSEIGIVLGSVIGTNRLRERYGPIRRLED